LQLTAVNLNPEKDKLAAMEEIWKNKVVVFLLKNKVDEFYLFGGRRRIFILFFCNFNFDFGTGAILFFHYFVFVFCLFDNFSNVTLAKHVKNTVNLFVSQKHVKRF
jgi:hypothetical protein